jgi:hypothetical protein
MANQVPGESNETLSNENLNDPKSWLFPVVDDSWFNRFDYDCSRVQDNANSAFGNEDTGLAIGTYFHNPFQPNECHLFLAETQFREDGTYNVFIEAEEGYSCGTMIVAEPVDIKALYLVSEDTGVKIPLKIITGEIGFIEDDDNTNVVFSNLADGFNAADIVKQSDSVWFNRLSLVERSNLESAPPNQIPKRFRLSIEKPIADEVITGPNTIFTYLDALLAQRPSDDTTMCCAINRGQAQILIIPNLHTKQKLQNARNTGALKDLIDLMFGYGKARHAEFGPATIDALANLADLFDLTILHKTSGNDGYNIMAIGEHVRNLIDERHIPSNRNELIKLEVDKRLIESRVPDNAIVYGSLAGFLATIGIPVINTTRAEPTFNISELEAILTAISSHDISFLGMTLIPPLHIGSKECPAQAAYLVGLPYPKTYRVDKGNWELLHPGGYTGVGSNAVVKPVISSGGDKVLFLENFPEPDEDITLPPNFPDTFIVMEHVPHHNDNGKLRDTRVVYDPVRKKW